MPTLIYPLETLGSVQILNTFTSILVQQNCFFLRFFLSSACSSWFLVLLHLKNSLITSASWNQVANFPFLFAGTLAAQLSSASGFQIASKLSFQRFPAPPRGSSELCSARPSLGSQGDFFPSPKFLWSPFALSEQNHHRHLYPKHTPHRGRLGFQLCKLSCRFVCSYKNFEL